MMDYDEFQAEVQRRKRERWARILAEEPGRAPGRRPRDPDQERLLLEMDRARLHRERPSPDPVIEAYKRHVDRTLLRQNLRRSVTERVANLIALQRLAVEARRAGGGHHASGFLAPTRRAGRAREPDR